MIEKIVAGGQTGVDRGSLDAALLKGLPIGGWCPKHRWAEDGTIPARYPLKETASTDVAIRTQLNAYASDATLILSRAEKLSGGTLLTRQVAIYYDRPVWIQILGADASVPPLIDWIGFNKIHVLNLAGPRESEDPGIQKDAEAFVGYLITVLER